MILDNMENIVLPGAIERTDFSWIGEKYAGKVRDVYSRGGEKILIATDRLSAFDRILTTVPLKGQVLTQLAAFWFEKVSSHISHHVVAIPDPNVMVVRSVEIIPIEVVVRGYLAGSAWRDYSAEKLVSGVALPSGMREFQKFDTPLITPSTKEAIGLHDTPISEEEIVSRGIVSEGIWKRVRDAALALFEIGTREVAQRGLLLADTKYEFGILNGAVVLADEIHTLDSSRFWVESSYVESLAKGTPPEMLDKEPVRRWLAERGFLGEGEIPTIADAQREMWMEHYVDSFKRITGSELVQSSSEPPLSRIEKNLRRYFGD